MLICLIARFKTLVSTDPLFIKLHTRINLSLLQMCYVIQF